MARSASPPSVLVDILKANQRRDPKMVRLKLKRMAESAFGFFRGACAYFARDWKTLGPRSAGPPILICGDLHLENLGAYRDDAGEFLFDINDFDESLVGPCAIDPVRCATSILLAAELWGLSPLDANRMVLSYLDEYRAAATRPVHARALDLSGPVISRGPIRKILGKTALATQIELLDGNTERPGKGERRIVRSKRKHPDLDRGVADAVTRAIEAFGQARGEPDEYRPIDVTGRVAGIGSLGLKRFLVLVAGGGTAQTNRLLDVKEERPSAWLPFVGSSAAAVGQSEAARVVVSQRTLQWRPTARLDVLPVGDAEFRVREMIPDENRSSLDRFQQKPAKLRQALLEAGRLTGLAHLRSAVAVGGRDGSADLVDWANGPALDCLLASAARYAERTRLSFKRFRAELRDPEALERALGEPVPD